MYIRKLAITYVFSVVHVVKSGEAHVGAAEREGCGGVHARGHPDKLNLTKGSKSFQSVDTAAVLYIYQHLKHTVYDFAPVPGEVKVAAGKKSADQVPALADVPAEP